jgi:hypothetical protein
MRLSLRLLQGLLALACCATALAQPAKPAGAPASPASAASAPTGKRAPAHVKVIEDNNVRIEEIQGRNGTVSKVTVHTKASGAKDYDVQVAPPGRDPNQDKGSAGRRTWSVLSF